jgi:hypothetical protein
VSDLAIRCEGSSRKRVVSCATLIVCGLGLLLPLLSYAYLGRFTRYIADDYCNADLLTRRGFLGFQIWQYQKWSGRFASNAVIAAIEMVGSSRAVPILPAVLPLLWLAVTAWAISELMDAFVSRRRWLTSVFLAEVLLCAVLRTAPSLGQSLYWQTGALTYTVPILLLTLYIGLVPRHSRVGRGGRNGILMLGAAVAFCAAGMSEINAALQCAALLLSLLTCRVFRNEAEWVQRHVPVLWAGFLGSLVSSMLVVSAPGNAIRERVVHEVTGRPALPYVAALKLAMWSTVRFVAHIPYRHPVESLVLLGSAALVSWGQELLPLPKGRKIALAAGLVCVFSFALVFSCVIPAVVALSSPPPFRAQLAASWIVLVAVLLYGVLLGTLAGHWYPVAGLRLRTPKNAATAVLLSLVFPWSLNLTQENLAATDGLRRYATEWEASDTQIRRIKAQGKSIVVLPWNSELASGGIVGGDAIAGAETWLSPDPRHWVNTCTADYYGLQSIATEPAPQNRFTKR